MNRELTWLKQMFTLAARAGKLMTKPYIPMLRENNARQGFFKPDQMAEVLAKLPDDLRAPIEFTFVYRLALKSEVLSSQWRHVDFKRGTVRLEPGEAKNDEPREIFMTRELRTLLGNAEGRSRSLEAKGQIVPRVFFRMVAKKREDRKSPSRSRPSKAFKKACAQAWYPGRIPHDLRRQPCGSSCVRASATRGDELTGPRRGPCSTATTS